MTPSDALGFWTSWATSVFSSAEPFSDATFSYKPFDRLKCREVPEMRIYAMS